jgi:hypothetical protein
VVSAAAFPLTTAFALTSASFAILMSGAVGNIALAVFVLVFEVLTILAVVAGSVGAALSAVVASSVIVAVNEFSAVRIAAFGICVRAGRIGVPDGN